MSNSAFSIGNVDLSSYLLSATAAATYAPIASPTFTGTVTLPAGQVVNGVTLTAAGSATDFLNAAGNYVPAGGGSPAFSAITSATNTTAAMVVGTGASLSASGSGTITATAAPLSGISGLGTGVATALAINTGSAGAVVLLNGALGTPSSGTATNLTGTAAGLTAGSVTNATLTTALTVNTGTVTLTGNVANTSVLTIGAGAVSVSGSNTGDQTSVTGNAGTATALQTGRTIAITGDLTYTSPSFDGTANVTAAGTLATVNANVGSFGSSTAIPNFTVNAKGLITAAGTNAVVAPAGTLTGATLAAGVTASSLTSVGTIATGVWNGTDIAVADGGTGRSTSTTAYGLIAAGTTPTGAHQTLAAGATTDILVGGGASALPVWTTAQGSGAPVRATSPTLTTPVIGVATGTSLALSGVISFTENQIDGTPNTDDTVNGPTTDTFNAGATVAQWELVYLGSSSTWLLADADAASTSGPVMLALAAAAGTSGNPMKVALPGSFCRNDAWAWTAGGAIYVDTTAGGLTQTAPSGAGDIVRVVGYAANADVIYFMPSGAWVEVT